MDNAAAHRPQSEEIDGEKAAGDREPQDAEPVQPAGHGDSSALTVSLHGFTADLGGFTAGLRGHGDGSRPVPVAALVFAVKTLPTGCERRHAKLPYR